MPRSFGDFKYKSTSPQREQAAQVYATQHRMDEMGKGKTDRARCGVLIKRVTDSLFEEFVPPSTDTSRYWAPPVAHPVRMDRLLWFRSPAEVFIAKAIVGTNSSLIPFHTPNCTPIERGELPTVSPYLLRSLLNAIARQNVGVDRFDDAINGGLHIATLDPVVVERAWRLAMEMWIKPTERGSFGAKSLDEFCGQFTSAEIRNTVVRIARHAAHRVFGPALHRASYEFLDLKACGNYLQNQDSIAENICTSASLAGRGVKLDGDSSLSVEPEFLVPNSSYGKWSEFKAYFLEKLVRTTQRWAARYLLQFEKHFETETVHKMDAHHIRPDYVPSQTMKNFASHVLDAIDKPVLLHDMAEQLFHPEAIYTERTLHSAFINRSRWPTFECIGSGLGRFYEQIGQAYDGATPDVLLAVDELRRSLTSMWWFSNGMVLAVDRPRYINVDAEMRLHSEKNKKGEFQPAAKWSDGFEIWAWRGIHLAKDVFVDGPSLEAIKRESNQESKRSLIELYGEEKWLNDMDATMLHEDKEHPEWGKLYEVGHGEGYQRVLRLVEPKPDPATGKHDVHFVFVPDRLDTALAACAWMFNVTEAEYRATEEAS